MSRYSADDIARLGPEAQRQIAAVRFGIDEQQRQRDLLDRPKRSKYGNQRVEVDGVWFDSKAEANRWLELKLLHRAGRITNLIRQPELVIQVNGVKICSYFADFSYITLDGEQVYEDLKSRATMTPVYRIKKKLCSAVLGIEITEVMT